MFTITFTLEQVMKTFGMEAKYAEDLIAVYDPRRVQYALDNRVDLCDLDRWEHLITLTADTETLAETLKSVGYPVTETLNRDVLDYVKAQEIIGYLYELEGEAELGNVPEEILEFSLRLATPWRTYRRGDDVKRTGTEPNWCALTVKYEDDTYGYGFAWIPEDVWEAQYLRTPFKVNPSELLSAAEEGSRLVEVENMPCYRIFDLKTLAEAEDALLAGMHGGKLVEKQYLY